MPRGELQHPLQLLPEARLVLEEVYREVDQLAAGDTLRQSRARNREILTFGHLIYIIFGEGAYQHFILLFKDN